jgi:hypothetical protein
MDRIFYTLVHTHVYTPHFFDTKTTLVLSLITCLQILQNLKFSIIEPNVVKLDVFNLNPFTSMFHLIKHFKNKSLKFKQIPYP